MKKYLIAGALSATVMGGLAFAAQPAPAPNAARPMSDGVMTREDALARADKRFDRLDFNHDGKVSEETMMAAHGGRGGPGMRCHGWKGRGMRGHGMGGGPDGMRRGPDGMHRGPGGPDGMRGGPGGMGHGPQGANDGQRPDPAARMAEMQAKAHEHFAKLDANHDGQVDRREFRAQAAERFARLDANNDGKVDAAERFAAREKMREQFRQMRGAPAPAPKPGA